MADKHTIEVTLEANTKGFKDSLKQALNFAKRGEREAGGSPSAKKAKERKQVESQRQTRKQYQESLRHEKALEKQMQKNLQMLEKVNKAHEKQISLLRKQVSESKKTGGGGGAGQGGRGVRGVGGAGGPGGMNAAGLTSVAKIAGGLAASAVLAAGGALARVLVNRAREAHQVNVQYRRASAGLLGTGSTVADLESARARAEGLGYTGLETVGQARQAAIQTGQAGAVTTAQSLSRVTTLDASGALDFMGTLTRAGQGFGGGAGQGGQRILKEIMVAAIGKGFDKARVPEVFKSIQSLVDVQSKVVAGDVGTGTLLKLVSAMQQSGVSGLQGARGGNVLQQLDRAIRQPGGGAMGQAFMLRAAGYGSPQGKSSYYDALKKLESGAFGDTDMVASMFRQAESEFGGGEATNLALKEITGLSLSNIEAMRQVVSSNQTSAEKQAQLEQIAESSKSIEEQTLDTMKSVFAEGVKRDAWLQNKLIDDGKQVTASMERIQDLLLRLIDKYFPLMVTSLEVIATVLEDIFSIVQEWSGKDDPMKQRGGINALLKESAKEQEELIRKRQLSQISQDEYKIGMSKALAKVRSARSRMTSERGLLTGMTEDVQSAFVSVGDMLFGEEFRSKTEAEKRSSAQQLLQAQLDQGVKAFNMDPYGPTRNAIQDFLGTDILHEQERKNISRSSTSDIEKMFAPGGAMFKPFLDYLQATSEQHRQALEVAREAARAAGEVARENAADGSAARRRPISSPTVEIGDFTFGR